uniref:Uncharacterized protein n=1 Tax=Anguilla anguilla TaxID=7936 RepID=A0A0E9TY66_ANGAN
MHTHIGIHMYIQYYQWKNKCCWRRFICISTHRSALASWKKKNK